MGTLSYSMHTTLDGYIEDATGSFDWGNPDEEQHRVSNQQVADTSALLFGRRMYEIMEDFWTAPERAGGEEVEAEFARVYTATPRIVFSDTLTEVADGCRLVRSADAVAEVQRLKKEIDGRLHVNGPTLAASLADLVDEVEPFVLPVTVGGGKPFYPLGVRWDLTLVEHRVYPASGVAYLRYLVNR